MKKFLSFILMTLVVSQAWAVAVGDKFENGDVAYKINCPYPSPRVSVIGLSTSGKAKTSVALDIPLSVAYSGVDYTITLVEDSAFINCTTIKSVNLAKATQLASLGTAAFSNCSNIETVTLNEGLKNIRYRVFKNCTLLKTIQLPSTVTHVDNNFVEGDESLATITVSSGNNTYASLRGILYDKEMRILHRCPPGLNYGLKETSFPETLTTVISYAFSSCSKISSIELPYGTQKIESGAFQYCTGLTSFKIPSSVTTLGSAFAGCTNLATFYINIATPPSILDSFFSGNTKKTTLRVPKASIDAYKAAYCWKDWANIEHGAYDISYYSFKAANGNSYVGHYTVTSSAPQTVNGVSYDGRVKLVGQYIYPSTKGTIEVPEDVTCNGKKYAVTSIGYQAVYSTPSADYGLSLGNNVDSIDAHAFLGQSYLKQFKPNINLKYIGNYAFHTCGITNDIKFSYGLKYVGGYAFYKCPIKMMLIPSSVSSMSTYAFIQMTSLEKLYLNKAFFSDGWTFTGVPTSCKLYVPIGYTDHYREHAKWSHFTNIEAGANDYAFNDDENSLYHVTILSTTELTHDGAVYCGKAKLVYHPVHKTLSHDQWNCSNGVIDITNGAYRRYLITQIGDSCLDGCSSIKSTTLKYMDRLEKIGDWAFYGTGIVKEEVPGSVTSIGRGAWAGCNNLTDLTFLYGTSAPQSIGRTFYGDNASGFTCNVRARWYNIFKDNVSQWAEGNEANQLNAYFYTENNNKYEDFAVNHPIDWEASGLSAYVVTDFDNNKVITSPAQRTGANVGVIVSGYSAKKYHKLVRPASSASVTKISGLRAITTDLQDIYSTSTSNYYFDIPNQNFKKPTSTHKMYLGHAYLLTLNSTASTLELDLAQGSGLKGDVDGNDVVDITDANILINIVLGKDSASNYGGRADVTGEGDIDVSDINAVLNIILGK